MTPPRGPQVEFAPSATATVRMPWEEEEEEVWPCAPGLATVNQTSEATARGGRRAPLRPIPPHSSQPACGRRRGHRTRHRIAHHHPQTNA
eukprot:6292024-Prymnesium_polylepis.2